MAIRFVEAGFSRPFLVAGPPARIAVTGVRAVDLGFFTGWALGSAVEHRLHTAGVSGSNPLAPTILRGSIPVTWVTDYSGDMGNTDGPNGFSIGSRRQVSSSKYPRS